MVDLPGRPGDVSRWSVEVVGQWLSTLGLPAELQLAFSKNAVDGAVLTALSDNDLRSELGCTPLQAWKVRQHLSLLGVPVPATSALASAAAVGVPVPATSAIASAAWLGGAAAPAPAVAATVGAEPNPKSAFDPADLQRYQQLEACLAELEGQQLEAQVSQAQAYLKSVQSAFDSSWPNQKEVEQALEVEQKRIATYSDRKFSWTGVFTPKHQKAVKLAEAQAKAESLSSQLAAAKAASEAQAGKIREAQAQLSAWQAKVADLDTTRAQLQELVESMFAAPAWRASPRLTQLTDALKEQQGQVAEAARGLQAYVHGASLLEEANNLLQPALNRLRTTYKLRKMGPEPPPDDDTYGEVWYAQAEHDSKAMKFCMDNAAKAAAKTLEARTLMLGLSQVDSRLLESARRGIFSKHTQGKGLVRVERDLAALAQQVKQACAWAQTNQVFQNKDVDALAAAEALQGEIDAFRSAALRKALA